jgi:hypothetical protein
VALLPVSDRSRELSQRLWMLMAAIDTQRRNLAHARGEAAQLRESIAGDRRERARQHESAIRHRHHSIAFSPSIARR